MILNIVLTIFIITLTISTIIAVHKTYKPIDINKIRSSSIRTIKLIRWLKRKNIDCDIIKEYRNLTLIIKSNDMTVWHIKLSNWNNGVTLAETTVSEAKKNIKEELKFFKYIGKDIIETTKEKSK